MNIAAITGPEVLIAETRRLGFLPFFSNEIPGFSIEEHTPARLWFSATEEGPWEWKGPAARSGICVYGKFFRGRAGFISLDWFPVFANYRRDGYDFDALYEDGFASHKDKQVYDTLSERGSLLSRELKSLCGYRKDGNKGFDAVITRLQMQSYVCIADFAYSVDKLGRQYGWGVARYTTPEAQFGPDLMARAYREDPAASRERVYAHLRSLFPDAGEKQIRNLLGDKS